RATAGSALFPCLIMKTKRVAFSEVAAMNSSFGLPKVLSSRSQDFRGPSLFACRHGFEPGDTHGFWHDIHFWARLLSQSSAHVQLMVDASSVVSLLQFHAPNTRAVLCYLNTLVAVKVQKA